MKSFLRRLAGSQPSKEPLDVAPASADASSAHGHARSSRHGTAAPGAYPTSAAELRASSVPQPLANGGAGVPAACSGPGAPVSPDPAAEAALRRVSSQPPGGGLSTSDSSLHDSSAAAGSAPAEQLQRGASGDADSSSTSGSLHIHFCGSGDSTFSSSGGDPASLSRPGASAPLAVTLGSRVLPVAAMAHRRSDSPTRWQPAHSGSAHGAQPPPPQQQRRQQQQPGGVPPGPLAQPAVTPVSLVAALAAAGVDDDDEHGLASPAHSGVSLLTHQLRGASAASSCCTSREVSIRGGMARSREASVRSGSRRTPVGGLTLALSRESSVKGGQAQSATASGGPRDAYTPTERSVSSGARFYRGLALADPQADLHTLLQRQAEAAALHGGCGSADWMGAPGPARLASMLDACDAAGGAAAAAGARDPFARPSRGSSRRSSRPVSCRPSAGIPEEEREQLLDIDFQPQEVGSWAERVTTFTNVLKPAVPADPTATHAGGPDPMLLSAALQALAGPGIGDVAAFNGGSHDAPQVGAQLVGDSELATMTGGDGHSGELHGLHTASFSSASAGSSGASAHLPAVLSSSWDAGDAAAAATALEQLGRLGCSAPTCGAAAAAAAARGLPGSQPAPGAHAAAAATAAAQAEWSRDFMRRWRGVKKRAYLQALGLRALWRVNSPSDRHEPLELLTNDLPQDDNGMRRSWSVSRLTKEQEKAARLGGSAALPATARRPSAGSLHKDPSLATLLLGEVAEVC